MPRFAVAIFGFKSVGWSVAILMLSACAVAEADAPARSFQPQGPDRETIENGESSFPEDGNDSTVDAWLAHIPIAGTDIQVKPYGSLWTNLYFATSRTNPGSFTLWVFSEQDHGESAVEIDARRTRLGVEVFGPDLAIGDLEFLSQGRVEFDFFGEFLTENRAGARLRHAYWDARNDEWRFLVGQTWDVISPLSPGMLNFSVGWAGGNIGFRRAQIRAERMLQVSNDADLTFQLSLNQDVVDDFPTDPGVRREPSGFPVLMGRTALEFPSDSEDAQPIVLGVSGHIGETGFDFLSTGPPPYNLPPEDDARFKTWSINADLELPLTDDLMFRCEFFHGVNLSPFLGGIGQGVCPCLRVPIESTGGWFEFVEHWSPEWESHCGFGIDDPVDADFIYGRTKNHFLFGNIIWNISERLSTGIELAWWRTTFQDQRVGLIPPSELFPTEPGNAITFEWMMRYNF